MNIEKMKRERKQLIDKAQTILTAQESRADKALTADEEQEYKGFEAEIDRINTAIEREERLQAIDLSTAEPVKDSGNSTGTGEFRNLGDFISELVSNPKSSRLERRTTTMGNPLQAGAIVPPEFIKGIRAISPERAFIRERAAKVPSSTASPDATTYMPTLDQFNGNGVHAGIAFNWVGETDPAPNVGDIKVQQLSFTPFKTRGDMEISNDLLDNYEDLTVFAQQRMSLAIVAQEETAFLRGSGLGQPTGFVGHPCNATATRGTSGQIGYNDLINMQALALSGGSYVWIVSRSAMSQLVSLKDSAGNLIWQPNAREGIPSMLFGYPVYFSERLPGLGSKGDVVLADLSYYGIKDGSPMALFVDPYTSIRNDITHLWLGWKVDAKPLLLSPIKGEDEVNRSAFVTLSAST